MKHAGPSMGNYGFYEIRSAGPKGRGAFALRNIDAGTRILVDDPIFVIEKHSSDISIDDILSERDILQPAARKHFDSLPFSPRFAAASADVQHQARFHLNNFWMLDRGWGCFAHASRFNNSCLPNCAFSQNKEGSIQVCVTRNVSAGDELTFVYVQSLQYMTTTERQGLLRPLLDWSSCMCELCSLPPDQRLASDMRRRLMRHLAFFIRNGVDLEGDVPGRITWSSYSPVPTFKVASEPVGYFGELAKAEGIVGNLIWTMYGKGADDLVRYFLDRSIAQVPEPALRTARIWVRRAFRMRSRFMGGADFMRTPIDDTLDKLVTAVEMLERSRGCFLELASKGSLE
ncbi:hypothetical protein BST61_g3506 [Cercospora zeina]